MSLSEGKLIILVTKKTRDESFFYVSKAREKKMATAIENVQKNLENKIIEEKQETL